MNSHTERKSFLAASVAACALAGTLAASPGFAQTLPGTSPGEQQETRVLNMRATDGTTQSPAVLNGAYSSAGTMQASGYGTTSGVENDNGPYNSAAGDAGNPQSGAPAYGQPSANESPETSQSRQYDSQMQQYGQQQQQYRDQSRQYDSDRARYRENLRTYDRATYDWSYPAPIAYEYDRQQGLWRLYLIAEPTQQLHEVPVEGPSGRWVGRVRNVETGPDGRPSRVEIALNRRVSVWVRPGDLRFDANNRILFTDLTRDDLWEMPGATVESGPL